MEWKKIERDDVTDPTPKGDFDSFNAKELYKELKAAIGHPGNPQGWFLSTNSLRVVVKVIDETLDKQLIDDTVRNHFKTDWSKYDEKAAEKAEWDAKVDACTTIKDIKDLMKAEFK